MFLAQTKRSLLRGLLAWSAGFLLVIPPVAGDGDRTSSPMENGLSVPMDEREPERAHFGTGFKIGEVTPNSAIVWTQLTERSSPVPIRHERGPGP